MWTPSAAPTKRSPAVTSRPSSGILDAGVEWHEPGGGNSPSGTFNGPDAVASEIFGSIQANFDEYSASRRFQ